MSDQEKRYNMLVAELLWHVRIEDAVCQLCKIAPEAWRSMPSEERIPFLEKSIVAMGDTPGRMTKTASEINRGPLRK